MSTIVDVTISGESATDVIVIEERITDVTTTTVVTDVIGTTQAGPRGATGPTGATGPAGETGPTGPQGAAGAAGPQGAAGAQGAAGTNGSAGAQGPQGAAGAQGAVGAQGAAGPAGPQGADGADGVDGADGADGPQGPQGAAGAAGPQGAQGTVGAAGPQGAQGAAGAAGPQGAAGAAGPQGDTGPAGAQGAAGAAGAQGAQGPQGAQGATGPNITALMPAGAVAETIDRVMCNAGTFAITSGTLVLVAVYLPIGTVVSTLHVLTGGTGNANMTHSWMGLFDFARVQLAVSADKTTTTLGSTTDVSFPIATVAGGAGASFTTTYSGRHYIGFMGSFSTGSLTMFMFNSGQSVPGGIAPIRVGTSNTSQTTPQAFAFTANALASINGVPYFYAA